MQHDLIAQMWLDGVKAEVICLTAGCSTATLHKVIKTRNLPRRGRTLMTELTRKILEYPRSTPRSVIAAELNCTVGQVKGARGWHMTERVKPVRSDTLSDDDKRLVVGLFGQLSFSEIARKLECTRSAVKQYAADVGFYESKADHLRALIAAGHSREHCIAMTGICASQYRMIAAQYRVRKLNQERRP